MGTTRDSRRHTEDSTAAGCCFVPIGLLFVIIGIYVLMEQTTFVRGAVSATGTIIACDFGPKGSCDPTIRFTTQAGQQITFQASEGSSSYREGGTVPVKYHLNDPQNARIDDETPILLVVIGMGALSMLIGLFPVLRGLMRWFVRPFRS